MLQNMKAMWQGAPGQPDPYEIDNEPRPFFLWMMKEEEKGDRLARMDVRIKKCADVEPLNPFVKESKPTQTWPTWLTAARGFDEKLRGYRGCRCERDVPYRCPCRLCRGCVPPACASCPRAPPAPRALRRPCARPCPPTSPPPCEPCLNPCRACVAKKRRPRRTSSRGSRSPRRTPSGRSSGRSPGRSSRGSGRGSPCVSTSPLKLLRKCRGPQRRPCGAPDSQLCGPACRSPHAKCSKTCGPPCPRCASPCGGPRGCPTRYGRPCITCSK